LVICGESQVILSRDDIQRTTIQYGTRVGYFVVLFLAISSSVYAQDQLPDLVRRIKPSAVAIETFDARGEKLTRGSGFFIDKDRVVTNRHVIDGAYRAEVHLNSGNSFPVKSVLGVDAEGDVALLKVDAPANQVRPLSLDRTSPQEGESVVVIGNPLGLEGSVTNGIVSAVRDIRALAGSFKSPRRFLRAPVAARSSTCAAR
jgi:S1-C subfamily serine protease